MVLFPWLEILEDSFSLILHPHWTSGSQRAVNLPPYIMPQEPQTLDPLLSKVPRPLYVDLDGTFVRTDTLWESIVELVRKKPFRALLLPFWVLGGKASFKRRVASEVVPETRSMPRRDEVVSLVKARREAGAKVYLATAADSAIAGSVLADGEGLFDGVIGSDGRVNLASDNKLAAIQAHAGGEPFDYVGDSKADLKVFAGASTSFIAGAVARWFGLRCSTHRNLRSGGLWSWSRAGMPRKPTSRRFVFTNGPRTR